MTAKLTSVPTGNSVATPPKRPVERKRSVSAALATGNYRSLLVAMERRLADTIDDPLTSAKDMSPLMNRLAAATKERMALDEKAEQDAAAAAAKVAGTGDEPWVAI